MLAWANTMIWPSIRLIWTVWTGRAKVASVASRGGARWPVGPGCAGQRHPAPLLAGQRIPDADPGLAADCDTGDRDDGTSRADRTARPPLPHESGTLSIDTVPIRKPGQPLQPLAP